MKTKNQKQKHCLHQILRRLVDEKGLSILGLAKSTGIPKSTLADWLNGSTPSDLHALKKLADTLGVTMAYLATGEKDMVHTPVTELIDLFDFSEEQNGIYRVVFQRLLPKTRTHVVGEGHGGKVK